MTVQDVLARLFRTYLYPPDYQPATTFLATPVSDDVDPIWQLGEFAVPEDENLVRQGSIIEVGAELAIIRQYNEDTNTVGVERGVYETPTSAHATGDPVILSPPYSRYSAFQSIGDNIITLSPKLYTVTAQNLVEVTAGVAGVGDDLAVSVESVWRGNFQLTPDVMAKIVDYHPAVGGRALLCSVPTGNLWVRYRRRMVRPTTEAATLDSLGVDEAWANIIIVGVAADLFAGRDLPASQVEWVSQVLQAENIEVGTRSSLSNGLARYRELLINRAASEMDQEYGISVDQQDPFMITTGGLV